MVVVLGMGEWEHSNFHSHFCTRYLLMQAPIQRHGSMWSQSDWTILLLQHITGTGQSHCRRRLCRPSQWHCWVSKDLDLLVKTVVLQMQCSIWSIHEQRANMSKGPIISSVHDEESSWCKFNHVMMHKYFIQGSYWSDSNSVNVIKWCLMLSQSRAGGACSLI